MINVEFETWLKGIPEMVADLLRSARQIDSLSANLLDGKSRTYEESKTLFIVNPDDS
jgi:hypothetical protein